VNAGRFLAGLTGVLGCALGAATVDSAVELGTLHRASSWPSVRGEVTASTEGGVPVSSRRLWRILNKYLLVENQFLAPTGQFSGQSHLVPDSDLHRGGSAEVRYNPQNPAQSLLVKSMDDRWRSAMVVLAITLPLAILMFFFARRLWRNSVSVVTHRD
jgi:hypothetical protein